ncbi:peptidase S41 [Halomicronema hongdechloris C2206]|uniref:Carboxyl-terminal-processing protease n=1 Tax=Halomicronema hongdechloris C2206 TaxID=1641165 RepID=A0A1Z3HHS7_9CYAN|nr:carboxyl-terminal processing protease CtpA [Halomicronema hongdechloris]ASC69830.1 peptidase S41 [Halomicronema hongdechloris C2206]
MKKRLVRVVGALLLSGLVWLGLGGAPTWALSEPQQLVAEAWRIVNRVYLDDTFNQQNWWFVRQRWLKRPLPDQDAAYAAVKEMLSSLEDPYTRLLQPEQYQSLQTTTSGELMGVGLQITKDEDGQTLRVIAPIEGSPAASAGIQPKDRVLAIDGASTATLTLDEAAGRMRGPVGTSVTLTVQRNHEEPMELTLNRDRITLNPVYADLRTGANGKRIGYLRLSQFNANATSELAAAIDRLEQQQAEAYVLDLRNNPGGLLQAGIEVARLWLDEGTIVYTVTRQGVFDSYEANGTAHTQDPLVVLVNQGTASASEILAGALQDNGRARLVGDVTFGKGLIQSLFDLPGEAGLAVTVAKYETPNHHDIHRLGITPDKVVEAVPTPRTQFGSDQDQQYQAAVEMLTAPAVIAGAQ